MDVERLNARIYVGRGKAAAHIGRLARIYRPVDALDPLANLVALLPVAFNAADERYAAPGGYGKVVWYADFDARQAEVGDYLVVQSEADSVYFFIVGKQSLLPVIAVACNRLIRVTRPAPLAAGTAGAIGYGGIDPASMIDVLGSAATPNLERGAGWPCAMIFAEGEAHVSEPLPAGANLSSRWMIYLPPSVPVVLLAGDRVVDDTGRVLVIDGVEQTHLGYRLQASEAHD